MRASASGDPPDEGDDQGTGGGNPNRTAASYFYGLLSGGGLLGILAVAVSIITLFFNHRATQEQLKAAQEQLTVSRYAHAIQELGSDRLPSRVAGIYELEQVALASPEHYQLGMEILADYLRTVSLVPSGVGAATPVPPNAAETVEIQLILKVLGRRPKTRDPVELDLSFVNLRALNLSEADLRGDDFGGSDFVRADLLDANLAGARLDYSDLTGAILFGANLTEASLGLANLTEATLRGADLTGADLTAANLAGADLIAANLAGATLSFTDMTGANLAEANLRGADLFGANLTGASLEEANLAGADLEGADLRGADLRAVRNLTQQQLDVAIIDETTQLPPTWGTPVPRPVGLAASPGSGTPWPPP